MLRILLFVVLCALVPVRGHQCGLSDCGDDGCVKIQCCSMFGTVGSVGFLCCGDRNVNESQACNKRDTTPGVCKELVCMSGRCRERNANAGTQCFHASSWRV
jgi:hypothetical protein